MGAREEESEGSYVEQCKDRVTRGSTGLKLGARVRVECDQPVWMVDGGLCKGG